MAVMIAEIREAVQAQATERHYTAKELAVAWKLDESTIRKMFMDVPGVLKVGHDKIRKKRRQYVTLRIPQSVMLAMYWSRINQISALPSPDQSEPGTRRRRGHNDVP